MTSREDLDGLLKQVASGNQSAHAALYRATSAKLFAVSLRVLSNASDAEDALQDSYVKIWNNAHRYRTNSYSPMAWLVTIARNTAIDRLRTRRPEQDYQDFADVLPSDGGTPEEKAVQSDERARLFACLEELEEDRRRAILGAYIEGRSYAELAEKAAVPLNTMRTWLRRGLLRLRECLSR